MKRAMAIVVGFVTLVGGVRGEDLGRQVVIVYNEREPEGKVLAEYYAEQRGVPAENLCAIKVRPSETISREEFDNGIRQPVSDFLVERGLLNLQAVRVPDPVLGIETPLVQTVTATVSFVVLLYGVPLRVDAPLGATPLKTGSGGHAELQRSEASVESELALLPSFGLPVAGPLRNPFYGGAARRFGPPLNRQMLLVGRLDAPEPAIVRRMIDDARRAEKSGLQGRAIFDARGIKDAGYVDGDTWIRRSSELFREAGFECVDDERDELLGEEDPITDVAVYAGWYATHLRGLFRREGFAFRPGAVAYHLHSSSGASIRSRNSYWVGPLLARGAAASMGNVFEPYLHLTPRVDLFFERLLEGGTFLEAAYSSQPALSWQTTFVGDPLYRPFGVSLEKQLAALEADPQRPDLDWAWVRRVNQLRNGGDPKAAQALCRTKAELLDSPILYEKLGEFLADRPAGAQAAFQAAWERFEDRQNRIRVAAEARDAARQSGDDEAAAAWQKRIDQARQKKPNGG